MNKVEKMPLKPPFKMGIHANDVSLSKYSNVFVLFIFFTSFTFFFSSGSFIVHAQSPDTVQIGSGTQSNGTSSGSPINIFFRSLRCQMVYTAAELQAAGITGPKNLDALGFSITGAPNEALPNYTIKIKNTSATDVSSHDGSGLNTYFASPSYLPSVGGFELLPFSQPFYWNGTDNILIDICFDRVSSWNSSGQVLLDSAAGSNTFRFVRSDGSSQCSATTSTVNDDRPQVQLIFSPPPSCPPPYDLRTDSISATSAFLNWGSDSATQWNIRYGFAGASLANTAKISGATNRPYHLQGLQPNTFYDFYVQDSCGVGDTSSWTGPFTFKTACASFNAPVMESFDSVATPMIPNCWSSLIQTSNNNGSVRTVSFNMPFSPPQQVQINNGGATDPQDAIMLITPELSGLTSQNRQISFQAKVGNGAGTLLVGTMTDPADTSTFEPFAFVDSITTQFQRFVIRFDTAFTRSANHIAFRHPLFTSGQSFFIDHFRYDTIPSCPQPTSLKVNTIDSNSVTVSWNSFEANVSNIQYGPQGFQPGNGTILHGITSNPYAITGLSANTVYDVYIQDSCSANDNSLWAGPLTIRTNCKPFTASFAEDFDSATLPLLPDCWSSIAVPPQSARVRTISFSGPNSAPNHVEMYNSFATGSQSNVMLITPMLWDLPNQQNRIRFQAKDDGNGTEFLIVGTVSSPSDTSSFTPFDTVNTLTSTYQEFEVRFDSYSLQHRYIALRHSGNDSFTDIYIDDFVYEALPSCPKPLDIEAASIDSNSATIRWTTGGAALWNIEYGPQGFSQGSGMLLQGVANKPYALTNLAPNTTYDVYIQDSCGPGQKSAWAGPFTFQTSCNPFTASYNESFDTVTTPGLPGCWSSIHPSSASVRSISFATPHSSPNHINLDNGSNTGSQTMVMLISPLFWDLPSQQNRIRFFAKDDGNGTESLIIGTISNPSDTSTFSPVDTISLASSYQEFSYWFDGYVGPPAHIAFLHSANATFTDIYIDDFVYEPIPSCPKPSGLNTTSVGIDSAVLGWTTGGAGMWNVEYGPKGFGLGNGTKVAGVTSKPLTLTGLNPRTPYEFYVQDTCGAGDKSGWVGPYAFTTFALPAVLPFIEDFESASGTFTSDTSNVSGFPEWQFITGPNGRLRLNAGNGFAKNGSQAATMDVITSGSSVQNYLILELNLSNYDTSSKIQLSFSYMDHGDESASGDGVWIRGSNKDPWVRAYDLDPSNRTNGVYNDVADIRVDSLLANAVNPQTFSRSFQVRFGQFDNFPANSLTSTDGITFDDIAITLPGPMKYDTSVVFQADTTSINPGSDNQAIIGLKVVTSGSQDTIGVTNFDFTTNGSDDIADIDSARVYYTGAVNAFSTDTLVGNGVSVSATNFSISGNRKLKEGANYFWLVYDVSGFANLGNNVDALATSLTVDSTVQVPGIGDTSGARAIQSLPCESINEAFSNTFPADWSRSNTSNVTVQNSCVHTGHAVKISGTETVTTKEIDTRGCSLLNISYWYRNGGGGCGNLSDNNDDLFVDYWDGTTWQNLATYRGNTAPTTFTKAQFSFSSGMNSLFKLRFRAVGGSVCCDDYFIDDVNIEASPDDNAAITSITSPVTPFASGSQPVRVILANKGNNLLDSVNIHYTINGATDSLLWQDGPLFPGDTSIVTLTNFTFNASTTYDVIAYSSNPNGVSDQDLTNDTAKALNLTPGLLGLYTIGGGSADFASFTEAANALNQGGVLGHVKFSVAAGAYNEQLTLDTIPGVSRNDTVAFDGIDSTQATLVHDGSGIYATLLLNGARHVTVKNLTIQNTASTDGWGVQFTNGADHNRIANCRILMETSGSNDLTGILASGSLTWDRSNAQNGDSIIVRNNLIRGGEYGIQLSYASPNSGWQIRNNRIDSFETAAIKTVDLEGFVVAENTINKAATSFADGILVDGAEDFLVEKNQINVGDFGIIIQNSGVSRSSLLINNMVSSTGERSVYITNTDSLSIYNNSFKGTEGAFFTNYQDLDVRNNIFYGTATFALNANQANGFTQLDHNIYYAPAHDLVSFDNTIYADLASFTAAFPALNNQSLEGNPSFLSSSDLHIQGGVLAYQAGDGTVSVVQDIDDQTRDPSQPDIGADEFTPPLTDAGIQSILQPYPYFDQGLNQVQVVLQNLGADTLQSAEVHWRVNGILQDTVAWSGSLVTGDTAHISMGAYSFSIDSVYTITAWTQSPNATTDLFAGNDTASQPGIYPKLNGTYTIGGSTPDFPNFSTAARALNNGLVTGSVFFTVRNGQYNEQVTLTKIEGASAVNTITFDGGDSSQTSLVHNGGGTYATLLFDGAEYITFRHLKIQTVANSNGWGVLLTNGADHNTIANCWLEVTQNNWNLAGIVASGSTTSYSNSGQNGDSITIKNNYISGGDYGIRLSYQFGNSGLSIQDNNIEAFENGGVRGSRLESFSISGNTFSSQNSSADGIYLDDCNDFRVRENRVTVEDWGIYISDANIAENDTAYVINNMITSAQDDGLRIFDGHLLKVFHNSVKGEAAVVLDDIYDLDIRNNIFYSPSSWAFNYDIGSGNGFAALDYNIYYTGGTHLVRQDFSDVKDLAAWRSAEPSLNDHSLEGDPGFLSTTDLHINGRVIANGTADSTVGVSTDFDGESRNLLNPDIGADEFTPPSADAGISAIASPSVPFPVGNNPIQVVLKNFGSDTLQSAIIQWQVEGQAQTPYTWSGSLLPADTAVVTIDNMSLAIDSGYTFKVWTAQPNGLTDVVPANDTLLTPELYAGLQGVYTIGGSNPDFASFGAAVRILNNGGVVGPVRMDVRGGTYIEQLEFDEIPGASATDTIAFRSENVDSSQVVLTYGSATSNTNYTILLNSADYLTFSHMTLRTPGVSYGRVFDFRNGASHNTVQNCRLEGNQVTTTSNRHAIVYSNAERDSMNTFRNNLFLDGSCGLHYRGEGTNPQSLERGTRILHNAFINQYFRGVFLLYQHSPVIIGDSISTNTSYQSYSGLYISFSDSSVKVLKNTITRIPFGEAIFIRDCDASAATPSLIANNFIEIGSGNADARGIRLDDMRHLTIAFNSVNVSSTDVNEGRAIEFEFGNYTNTMLLNNILANTGGGYAMYINSSSVLDSSDFNNIYASGSNLGYWAGSDQADMSAWRTASGLDANSLSVDPVFTTTQDLHTAQSSLNGKAVPLAQVNDDIDGEQRDATNPDIGADEFTPSATDAGLEAFVAPAIPFAEGVNDVKVRLRNFGTDTLTSVKINWQVNGTPQTDYQWNGTLAPDDTSTQQIGTFSFNIGAPYDVKVWTSFPDSASDAQNANDTVQANNLYAALSGAYTLGGASPDFPDFSTAALSLNKGGVVGPVQINVRAGTYNEQVVLQQFPGSSASHPVTFRSETSDSSDVILTYGATGSMSNYTVLLDGTDYTTFEHLTLRASGNTYARVIDYRNHANYLTVKNCLLQGVNTSNNFSTSNRAIIYSGNDRDTSFVAKQNRFEDGRYALYLNGDASFRLEPGTQIIGNQFVNQNSSFVYLHDQLAPLIQGNRGTTPTPNEFTAIECNTCDDTLRILANELTGLPDGNGIFIRFSEAQATQRGLIANNFIQLGVSGDAKGIWLDASDDLNVYHNTVRVTSTSTTNGRAIDVEDGSGIVLKNNIFANTGGGYSIYTDRQNNIALSDYNNFYTTTGNLGSFNGNVASNISAWRNFSQQDTHSLALDPFFAGKSDLHISQVSLDQAGDSVGHVTTDIDGQMRDIATPDIGADAFTPDSTDAGIMALYSPQVRFPEGNNSVKAVLKNYGGDTIFNVSVHWAINDTLQQVTTWNGSLASGDTAHVFLADYHFQAGQRYDFDMWTSSPNGIGDAAAFNDSSSTEQVYAALQGEYTLGGVQPDFSSFQNAAQALKFGGVLDSVLIKVRNGTYNEQVVFEDVPGASFANSVKFRSEASDSSQVTLVHLSIDMNQNYTLLFDDVDHLIFEDIKIKAAGNTYGRVVAFENGSHFIKFQNCWLQGKSTSSTQNDHALVYSFRQADSANSWINNRFEKGSYGLYYIGSASSGQNRHHRIQGNHFVNQRFKGAFLEELPGVNFVQNHVTTNSPINFTGVELEDCEDSVTVTGNKITGIERGNGLILFNCDASSAAPNLVANNFIQIGDNNQRGYGIIANSSNYTNLYYNTVNVTSTDPSNGRALYLTNNFNINVQNNVLANTGGGYSIFKRSFGSLNTSNYNNLYTAGSTLAHWDGADQSSLNNWQSASSQDANSVSVNPDFVSPSDLHVREVALNAAATPLAAIANDIDGEPRDASSPDIGADEFTPVTTDAGIIELVGPVAPVNVGNSSVQVTLKNLGSDTLTNVTVQWAVNDTLKSPVNWTGQLSIGDTASVNLGAYNFRDGQGYAITAWTESPNGNIDQRPKNDTLNGGPVYTGLQGIYTLGGSNPDFTSFMEANTALLERGVLDSVVFDVRNGSYNEQLLFREITGASADHDITFRSENGDSSLVTLVYTSNSIANYVVRLDGADFIRFRDVTIQTSGFFYGRVIDLQNGAHNLHLQSCRLIGSASNFSNNFSERSLVNSSATTDSATIIENSHFEGGSYAVLLQGDPNGIAEANHTFSNNLLTGQVAGGIQLFDAQNLQIDQNVLTTNTSYLGYSGVSLIDGHNGATIVKNKIYGIDGGRGIRLSNYQGTASEPVFIANNFIQVGTNGTAYGLLLNASDHVQVYHNNVNITSTDSQVGRAIYLKDGSNYELKNNVFANTGGGYSIYTNSLTNIAASDYNDLFTTGAVLGYSSANRNTLSDWQAGNATDANSISADPLFTSTTNLHVAQTNLDSAATSLGSVQTDIDNQPRNPNFPDIGADEFGLSTSQDVGIVAIDKPQTGCGLSGSEPVTVELFNFGSTDQSAFDVSYSVDGNTPVTENTGSLTVPAGGSAFFTFTDSADLSAVKPYAVQAYTSLSGDADLSNDTASLSVVNNPLVQPSTSDDTTVCAGNQVNLSASGGSSYQWSNGAFSSTNTVAPSVTTDYIVTVTNTAGCSATDTVTVSVNGNAPSLAFTGEPGYVNSLVEPDIGSSSSAFSFAVNYLDMDGDLPAAGEPKLKLDFAGDGDFLDADDVIVAMQEADPADVDATNGKKYVFTFNNLRQSSDWKAEVVATDNKGCASQPLTSNEPDVSNDLLDLSIFANDITFSDNNPDVGEQVTINATIHNNSAFDAGNFDVTLYEEDTLVSTLTIGSLSANSQTTVSWNYVFGYENYIPMKVVVDEPDSIVEDNELNNFAIRPITIGDYNVAGSINVNANVTPARIKPGNIATLNGSAQYVGTFSQNSDVSGAQVDFEIIETGAKFSGFTNSSGNMFIQFPPPLDTGTYTIEGTVTDFTLTGNFGPLTFEVIPPPSGPDILSTVAINAPLRLNNLPAVIQGTPVDGQATVVNAGDSATAGFNFKYESCEGLIADQAVNSLAPGGNQSYQFTRTFQNIGVCNLRSDADYSDVIDETEEFNNVDVQSFRVLPPSPDLKIVGNNINGNLNINQTHSFYVKIGNYGGSDAGAFQVKILDVDATDTVLVKTLQIPFLAATGNQLVSFSHQFQTTGQHTLIVKVDEPVSSGGAVAEFDETNNTGQFNVNVFAPLTNLKVTPLSLNVEPVTPANPGDSLKVKAEIFNTGGIAVPPGDSIEVRVSFQSGGSKTLIYDGGIAAQSSAEVHYYTTTPPFQSDELSVIVDQPDDIVEFNENDNQASYPLCWDFKAANISLVGGPLEVGQSLDLRGSLFNEGLYTADSLKVRFYVDSVMVDARLLKNIGPTRSRRNPISGNLEEPVLELRQSHIFTEGGNHWIKIETDYPDDWPECSEGNNKDSVQVFIKEPAPDLEIRSKDISPSELNPDKNEPIDVFVSYKNTGQLPSGGFSVRTLVDSAQLGTDIQVPGIASGEDTTVQVNAQYSTPQPGAHVIRSFVDFFDLVSESDEKNNEASRALIVGDAPNLFFEQLSFSNQAPSKGDFISITATVVNGGNKDCQADVRFYYIDEGLLQNDTVLITSQAVSVDKQDTNSVNSGTWQVPKEVMPIYCEIVNANPTEYNFLDNTIEKGLGPQPQAAIVSTTKAQCNGGKGGSARVAVTGGTSPYEYKWSNGAFNPLIGNVKAGSYVVTVTDDNGYTDIDTAVVTEVGIPAAPTITTPGATNFCPGDSLLLVSNVDTNITWSTGATNDSIYVDTTGTYSVTLVSGNGCSVTSDFSVNQLTQPTINPSPYQTICRNDTATLTVQNANTYLWETGDTSQSIQVAPTDTSYFSVTGAHLISGSNGATCTYHDSIRVNVLAPVAPDSVTNMLPVDSSNGLSRPVALSWSPAFNASHYDVYVWPDTSAKPALPSAKDINQIGTLYGAINYGDDYLWQVVSKNSCKQTAGPVQTFTLRDLPDLQVDSVKSPVSAFSGQTLTVDWQVVNNGTGNTQSQQWTDAVYLSKDTELNSGVDHYLGGTANVSALQAGERYAKTSTFNLPQGVTGYYYLLIITDKFASVDESDNANNKGVSIQPVNINLTPPPDLKVTSVITPNNAFSGNAINVSWTVTNNGSGTINSVSWADRLYLSTDASFNRGNVLEDLLVNNPSQTLQPDSSYTVTKSLLLPPAINGRHFVYVETDVADDVYEHAFEANNITRSDSISVTLSPPADLRPVSITIPDSGSNDVDAQIKWTVENKGGAPTNTNFWLDRVYISTDAVFHPDSVIRMGTFPHWGVLQPGQGYTNQKSITLPRDINGPYYVFVHTDRFDDVYEFIFTGNNRLASNSPMQVVSPDLAVNSINQPGTDTSGTTTQISWDVINNGAGKMTLRQRTDKVWLSANASFNPSNDLLLDSLRYDGSIEPGDTLMLHDTIRIPHGLSGQHYLFVETDANNEIFENSRKANNRIQQGFQVILGPWADVEVTSFSMPDTVVAGFGFMSNMVIENKGNFNLVNRQWLDNLYISRFSVWNDSLGTLPDNIDTSYRLLASFAQNRSLASDSSYRNDSLIVPDAGLSSGTYYGFAFTDKDDQIYEPVGQNDNVMSSGSFYLKRYPPVDLAVTKVTAPDSAASGQPITLGWSVRNNSNIKTLPSKWADGLYLSSDTIWDPQTDTFLQDWTINGPVNPSGHYSMTETFQLPQGLSGNYYLIMVTDHGGANRDSDLSNNFKAACDSNGNAIIVPIKLTLAPDLQVSSLNLPSSGFVGQQIQATWKVQNTGQGATDPGQWRENFYLSQDFKINQGDRLIGSYVRQDSLLPGESYSDTLDLNIPPGVSPGNYIVIMKTDANKAVYEGGNDQNNLASALLSLSKAPVSDLTVPQVLVEDSVRISDSTTVQWTTTNTGQNPAVGNMKETVYLSGDRQWDVNDQLFGSVPVTINLAPQSAKTDSFTFAVSDLQEGGYHAIVKTDILNNINEAADTNNTGVSSDSIQVGIEELPLEVWKSNTLINRQKVYYRVEIPDSLKGETLLVELRGDSVNGANELYVSHESIPTRFQHDFAFDQAQSGNQNIIVPSLQKGTYYLMATGQTTAGNSQNINLKAGIMEFEIFSVTEDQGGKGGQITVKIKGAKFEKNMHVSLINDSLLRPGYDIEGMNIRFVNSTVIFATFDLTDNIAPDNIPIRLGAYDLEVQKLAGDSAVLVDGFEVVPGQGDGLLLNIDHPPSTLPNRIVPMSIEFVNASNNDLPVPRRALISTDDAPVGFQIGQLSQGQTTIYLEFREPNGPPDVLRPGVSHSITVFTKSVTPRLRFRLSNLND